MIFRQKRNTWTVTAAIVVLSTCVSFSDASAWDFSFTSTVRFLQVDAMPDRLVFKTDNVSTEACEDSADWLSYDGDPGASSDPEASVRATYAALLVAVRAQSQVGIFGNFGTSGECNVERIYIY